MRVKRNKMDTEKAEESGGHAMERQRQYRKSRGLPPVPDAITKKPDINPPEALEVNEKNNGQ